MNARKKYSKEFKLDAISLVVDQKFSRAEAARSLEINPNLITRWMKEHEQDNDGQAFRGNGKLTPEQEEIRQLRAMDFPDFTRQSVVPKSTLPRI